MQALGQAEPAVQLLKDGYESLSDRTAAYALRHLQALCYVCYMEGEDLELVRQTARKIAEESAAKGLDILQSWALFGQASLHLFYILFVLAYAMTMVAPPA